MLLRHKLLVLALSITLSLGIGVLAVELQRAHDATYWRTASGETIVRTTSGVGVNAADPRLIEDAYDPLHALLVPFELPNAGCPVDTACIWE